MAIIFFAVVTPIGVLMRLLGKDNLNLKFNKSNKSYWIQKSDEKRHINLFLGSPFL